MLLECFRDYIPQTSENPTFSATRRDAGKRVIT
jgi:hypothetical protein